MVVYWKSKGHSTTIWRPFRPLDFAFGALWFSQKFGTDCQIGDQQYRSGFLVTDGRNGVFYIDCQTPAWIVVLVASATFVI